VHFELAGLPPRRQRAGAPTVDVCAASGAQLLERWSGPVGNSLWQTVFEDGASYVVQPGRAGDHLIEYAGRADFHVSADGLTLTCADPLTQPASWRRTLTDSVLWTVALLHGAVLLHASAVEGPGGAVAIVAAQGSGKSSLASQLTVEGWPLVTDDILAFERRGEQIIGHPGPSLMNVSQSPGSTLSPDALGEVLATFRSPATPEAWVLVRRFSEGELPLGAIVLLKRAGNQAARIARLSATTLDLAPHTLAFAKLPGAQARRFEAVSDLVERVPVFCIEAGVEVPPAELAAILRTELQNNA
jgi:hypothetical protein